MNWCKPHWSMLRETVVRKGLGQFVARDGAEAAENFAQSVEGGGEAFDPLMGSWARINAYMIESPACRGRILMCPLCILVEDGQPETVSNWLEGVTDQALDFAVEQGLVPTQ